MNTQVNKVILAPMEGVVDALMRDLLTNINAIDLCITEFIRVVDCLLPKSVFYRINPELNNQGFTSSGTPIRVQLLGQDPNWLAENAVRALELGSHGIDLNFGCPSKTVNKNRGGAILLKSPDQIYAIASTVKKAIGKDHALSVKIRLGFDDSSQFNEIIDAVVQSGANLLTIHARTKKHGYKPPAYWDYIGKVSDKYNIDLVANGEVWSKTDAINCIKQSKTSNLMLGRGLLALPNLANIIKSNELPLSWENMRELLIKYSELELGGDKGFYYSSRLKQWLRYLKLNYIQANELFEKIKRLKNKNEILALI